MQAFGPYANTEIIDFSELNNRTMFVISGKTGSGKTTIFDGISFAIYGRASGEDRGGADLRSQFASDEILTEVSLQFTLKGKSYFIKRAPQQEKKKERGDGYRTIGAQAELYVIDEHGEQQLIAANVREVDEKIKDIMLIDSNQFRQILMIPQGEFRKLLTSDSKEKEVILQRLFHTEIYKRVEEKLKEEAIQLKRTVENQLNERNQWLRKISARHHEELRQYLNEDSTNDALIFPLLLTEIELMTKELEQLQQRVVEKEKEKECLQQQFFEAEAIVKQLKQKKELQVQKLALEGLHEQFAEKEAVIHLANKALLLAKQEQLCQRLKNELDRYSEDLRIRKVEIESLQELLQQREKEWHIEKEREPDRKAALAEVHGLQQMRSEVQTFASLHSEVERLKKSLLEVKEASQSAEERLKKREQSVKALHEEKQGIDHVEVSLLENARKMEQLEAEFAELTKYEQLLTEYRKVTNLEKKSLGELGQVDRRLNDAKLLLEELENKWLHGQAAILASGLTCGDACPVCGSSHHPNLALPTGELPNEVDLKAAREQVEVIRKEKGTAELAFYEIQSQRKTVENSLAEVRSEIEKKRNDFANEQLQPLKVLIHEQQRKCREEHEKLKAQRLRLGQIKDELEKYEQKISIGKKELEQSNEQVNAIQIAFAEKNSTLSGLKERIPEELRSDKIFDKKLKAATLKQEQLQHRYEEAQKKYAAAKEGFAAKQAAYATVTKQHVEKEQELAVEREQFVAQMTSQGFENYKAYAESKRSEVQIKGLENELRQYREELRTITDRFNELTLLLKDVETPNLAELQQQVQKVQAEWTTLNDQYRELYIEKRDNEEIRQAIEQINKDMKSSEEKYKLIGHLYEITKGQNTHRITFERYVLAAFLDHILYEANGRLRKMTSGRYEMIRKTERAKGNAQSGLELLVYDQYTGQERHVKTLSGGESFKAALALALGLADVVQNFAGGVSLETMFIDEGFGTLDPESLDQAIEALIDIQSSGRLVGIISHVPELRERIDARLEVTATQTGSTTEFHFLNG